MKTTYRSLNPKARAIVDRLPDADPLKRANELIDRAVALQDAGDPATASQLLGWADGLLKEES